MSFNFTADKPIYVQLIDQIKYRILTGELPLGSKLASVRDLAVEAKVNPNTMQKALAELEQTELIRAERTTGRFITENSGMIESMRKGAAKEETKIFLSKMHTLKFSTQDAISFIKEEVTL